MIDLHCHILPSMDDGAKDLSEALKLVDLELSGGIKTIAATPHFNSDCDDPEEFLMKREKKLKSLKDALEPIKAEVTIVGGAEIYLSPKILENQFKRELCYSGSNYMLVELPMINFQQWIPEILYRLKLEDIIPVIAHVERYAYFERDPALLYELVSSGSIAQVNASSLVSGARKTRHRIFRYMEHNLIHIIATDAHSVDHRPPFLNQAMLVIEKKFGRETAEFYIENSKGILENDYPDIPDAIKI